MHTGPGRSKVQTNSVSEAKGTGRFHASTNVLNFRPILPDEVQLVVDFTEMLASKHFETRNHPLACEIGGGLVRRRLRNLDLQSAFSKVQTEDFLDVVLHFGFEDHIVTGDAEIDVTLSDEGRDIRGRKKNPENPNQSSGDYSGVMTETYSTRSWFNERQTSRRWCLRNRISAPEDHIIECNVVGRG